MLCLLTSFLSSSWDKDNLVRHLSRRKSKSVLLKPQWLVVFCFSCGLQTWGNVHFLGAFSLHSYSYLMVSSVVGFYSLRCFGNFTPKKDDTTMTKVGRAVGAGGFPLAALSHHPDRLIRAHRYL